MHAFTQNQIWCAIVALASELTAWMQLLALPDADGARRWEPKRLRYRLYTIPAALARSSRQVRLRYAAHHPWVTLLVVPNVRSAIVSACFITIAVVLGEFTFARMLARTNL